MAFSINIQYFRDITFACPICGFGHQSRTSPLFLLGHNDLHFKLHKREWSMHFKRIHCKKLKTKVNFTKTFLESCTLADFLRSRCRLDMWCRIGPRLYKPFFDFMNDQASPSSQSYYYGGRLCSNFERLVGFGRW